MRVVILVPRRDGIPERDALWAWCKAWWARQFPDWPIVEGHHDEGPFNRSAAINRAAELAGRDWDVALIIDSDAFCDPDRVRQAVLRAYESDRMVLPFRVRKDLSREGSERVMAGFEGSWDRPRLWYRHFRDMVSTIVAVSRTLWDLTGGFDEGFRGWGWEDNAFSELCLTFGGPIERLEGDAWHLWHEAAPEVGGEHPLHLANKARHARYMALRGDKERIAQLRHDPPVDVSDPRIPRILHRVVPEETSATAEAWWARFEELHPGWRMLTHRDPLDPRDWPLTARHWRRVKVGAQLADLVRLEALLRWGGFYVDSDVQPLRSFEPLRLVGGVVAAWEDDKCVPNAVLGAPPGHDAIRACLDLAIKRLPRGDVWKAGPGVTTEVLAPRTDALLLPPETFYAVHYRDPDRDVMMRRFDAGAHPWSYGLHWYAGSWLPEERQRPLPDVAAPRRALAAQRRHAEAGHPGTSYDADDEADILRTEAVA